MSFLIVNSTYHTLPLGKQFPLGWTCGKATYSEFPAGCIGLCGIDCVTPIFLSKSLQFVTRITSALAVSCNGSLHLLDPMTVAATAAFLSFVQGLVGLQGEVPKIACQISKTTNVRAKVSAEINQEMGGLRTTVH